MKFQIEKRRVHGGMVVGPEYTQVGDDKIIARAGWIDADGRRAERYQVLTVRNGKIIDMQGCRSRREAERFARRK